jgi:hypothetical protein
VIKAEARGDHVHVEVENAWGSTFEQLSPEAAEKLARQLVAGARKARRTCRECEEAGS